MSCTERSQTFSFGPPFQDITKLINYLALELVSQETMKVHPLQNKDTVPYLPEDSLPFSILSFVYLVHSTNSLESRNDADLNMFYYYLS